MISNDLKAAERRLDIVLYLSQTREVHYNELIKRYNVSAPVIRRDLNYIEDVLRVPIVRKRGRAGSIKIANSKWNIYQKHLSRKQEDIIKKAISLLDVSEQNIMQSVLNDFAPRE